MTAYVAIVDNEVFRRKISPVIAELMKVSEIAGGLTQLLNDPLNKIEFLEAKAGILLEHGGAATDPSYNWLDDGVEFQVFFNEQDAQQAVKCEYNVELSLKAIIAHELGHCYFLRYIKRRAAIDDKENLAFAVKWEAYVMGSEEVRQHNISAECRGITVPPAFR